MIQERIRAAQSGQKSYYDRRRKDLEFVVGDHVFLRVTLWTGVGRALKSCKLTPRFIGPISLSSEKYVHDPLHVIKLDDVQVKENFTYETLPLRIDDRMVNN